MNRRAGLGLTLGILAVSLLLAGVVSFHASSSPDGLSRVAQDQGFASAEETHPSAEGPLAGYDTGLGRVAGVLVVLVLAGGLALVVRRRRTD